MKPEANTTAPSVVDDFDRLVQTYEKILRVCQAALAPGKTQQERNAASQAIAKFLDN